MEAGKKIHFIGIGGSGMSALSQIAAMEGRAVTGSDRDFDNGRNTAFKTALERLGIKIFPQDGSGIERDTAEVAVSTAIEDSNPEISKARSVSARIIHRSELLSSYVDSFKTIAVGGTSGKSTVVGMIFTILEEAGFGPGVITGGPLVTLKERGFMGNAWLGKGPSEARGQGHIMVIEADESDGTIVKYRPAIGLILNISKDHKDVSEIKNIFKQFAGNVKKLYVNADDPELADFGRGAELFGRAGFGFRLEDLKMAMFSSSFRLNGVDFELPAPGSYNIENALAAVRVALDLGVKLELCAEGLKKFRGIQRRFELIGEAGGITVLDDYAHNPAKISAVLGALRRSSDRRLIVVYQPHGYSPTRHLRRELVESFTGGLASEDILIMPEIYYAGGTVAKDISSEDLVKEIAARGRKAFYFKQRVDIIPMALELAAPGDIFIVMGARDWTLSDFARELFEKIKRKI
ncbi:MAG: hypothetical protein A2270_01930 [Elusimicrobia bacterium RIFOXYA12_FULL_51_18]|nr:MAG: hypothetical protein A2270_01930 [Elusimicrobia bacterium RIFOXYA12_FULL_51_18]OGS32496.1 MAG: hypothetical protein A2218_03700 [Elusimicrobia bacterium RIFOXYA2_FULL_53_38]